jgi:ribosomal protein S6
MFLVDSALAAQDYQMILDEIQRVLDRAGADVVSQKKWDERRLCYEIDKKSRGTYILTYFNCDTSKIGGIERDVQLSELLTRVLILRTDNMTPEDLEKATPLELAAAEEAAGVSPRKVESDEKDEDEDDLDSDELTSKDTDDTEEDK